MGKIIGIDLGTTNSAVSVIEGGKPKIINNEEGHRTTPSVVAFVEEGNRKVGDSAKRQSITNPEKTIYSIKRFIGKGFKEITNEAKMVPYTVENSNGVPSVKIDDRKYTPQEISAIILQKLKKAAEAYLGYEVKEAVITVPAYFNDQERKATMEAGKIAGLEVKRIINEPTAAALAYGLDKTEEDKTIAVFDLGGGTFDISILELGDGVFEVKSTDGDTHLGGDNVDEILINWMADKFKSEFDLDLREDPMALQRLKESAEKAKIELSSTTSTEINIPYIMPVDNVPKHFNEKLTRSEFNKMIDGFVKRAMKPCKTALKNAGIKDTSKIDEVILVGGSTRIPAIQEAVTKFFGREPNKSVNPDEVVSLGAAIQGGVLNKEIEDVLLLDVTPLSLGIETMGAVFTKLIEANTTIPSKKTETFSTASDNQPSVQINVAQGERPMFADNKPLGTFHLDGIPPTPRGVPQIEVIFDLDANGILTVSAKDRGTGKENQIRIEGGGQLSDAEIEKMRKEAEENSEADIKRKEEVDKLNSADQLVFTTQKFLNENEDKLEDSDKESLKEKSTLLKEAYNSKNIEELDKLMGELQTTWTEVSTKLYQQSQPQEESQESQPNVEDVDFEEVKDSDDTTEEK